MWVSRSEPAATLDKLSIVSTVSCSTFDCVWIVLIFLKVIGLLIWLDFEQHRGVVYHYTCAASASEFGDLEFQSLDGSTLLALLLFLSCACFADFRCLRVSPLQSSRSAVLD